MSLADNFRDAIKLMNYVSEGHSSRSYGVPQDVPNYSARGLSGASTPSISSQQSGLATFSQMVNLGSQIGGAVASLF